MDPINEIKLTWYELLLSVSFYTDYPFVHPKTCSIGITSKCNSRCAYCNTWRETGDDVSFDALKKLLLDLKAIGLKEILYSGGEPFLRQDIIQLVELSIDLGFQTRVITNGTVLSKEIIEKLACLGIQRIGISIDTLDPETYMSLRGIPINRCLQSLEELVQAKKKYNNLQIVLYTVITKTNITDILALVDYAHQFSFGNYFQPVQMDYLISKDIQELWPSAAEIDNLETIIRKIVSKKHQGYSINNLDSYLTSIPNYFRCGTAYPDKCLAGYIRINIDKDLELRPCWMLEPVGNVVTSSVRDIWFSSKMYESRKRIRQLECPGCLYPCHIEGSYSFGRRT